MVIDRAALVIRRELGKGGFGTVYEVATPQGLTAEAACAYKEFSKAGADDIANLRVLVDFRRTLPASDIAMLDSFATWPLEIVESGGRIVGYLMRVVPDRFVEDSIIQSTGTTTKMRGLEWLTKPDHARRSGAKLVVDADDYIARLAYCAQLARVVCFLHQRGVVFGDLSQTNAVYSGSPAEVMLIDLDPVRIEGQSPVIRQAHSPGLSPPECRAGQKVQDVFSDRFKLAVLFYNILGARAQVDSRLSGLTGRIDDTGLRMFSAALGRDTHSRPHADAWYRYFYEQVQALSSPPVVDSFTVRPARLIAGQTVELSWAVSGHRSLTLDTPWGERRQIGVSAPCVLRMPVQRSGQFRLTAANPSGSVDVDSEIVYAFEPPSIRRVVVPALGEVPRCITGIDSGELAEMATLRDGFSWVTSIPGFNEEHGCISVDTVLSDVVGSSAMDTRGLESVITGAMADAEDRFRTHIAADLCWPPDRDRVLSPVRAAVERWRSRMLDRVRWARCGAMPGGRSAAIGPVSHESMRNDTASAWGNDLHQERAKAC